MLHGHPQHLLTLMVTKHLNPKAPEICIEIVSPSNSKIEMAEKVNLYLAKGAQEVWIIYDEKRILTYTHIGEIEKSEIAAGAQRQAVLAINGL